MAAIDGAPPTGSLATFFAAMVPYLKGERSADDVAARLGPSPSGARRLGLYRWLVERDTAVVLEKLYPGVREAVGRVRAGLWEQWTREFVAAHPPTHWHVNRFGEPFPEFVAARRRADPTLPAYLEELADFYWIRYAVATASPDAAAPHDGIDAAWFLRQYTHAVPGYVAALQTDAATDAPAARVTVAIVYRDATTLAARVLTPTVAMLVAIARRQGRAPAVLPVDLALVDDADRQLVVLGIFR